MMIGKLEIIKVFDGLIPGDRGAVHMVANTNGKTIRAFFPQTGWGVYDLDIVLGFCKPISGAIVQIASEVLKENE
jgi:hypothetical protein